MNVCADKNRCAWPRSHRGDRFERFPTSKQTGRNPPLVAVHVQPARNCPPLNERRLSGAAYNRLNDGKGRKAGLGSTSPVFNRF
jgi:hypothetical protein